jgi:hypothetical protein
MPNADANVKIGPLGKSFPQTYQQNQFIRGAMTHRITVLFVAFCCVRVGSASVPRRFRVGSASVPREFATLWVDLPRAAVFGAGL